MTAPLRDELVQMAARRWPDQPLVDVDQAVHAGLRGLRLRLFVMCALGAALVVLLAILPVIGRFLAVTGVAPSSTVTMTPSTATTAIPPSGENPGTVTQTVTVTQSANAPIPATVTQTATETNTVPTTVTSTVTVPTTVTSTVTVPTTVTSTVTVPTTVISTVIVPTTVYVTPVPPALH